MPRSYASTTVAADPDTVWAFLRDFNATPQYVEAVSSSEMLEGTPPDRVGAERRLVLADGAPVRERLVALDDVERSFTYHLLEGPFPLSAYYSTICVKPVTSDKSSFIEWWSTYDCAAADATAMDDLLAGTLYGGGLKSLRRRFA